MQFAVFLKLTWSQNGRLTCALSDWAGPLDERLLAAAEAAAVAIEAMGASRQEPWQATDFAGGAAH